LVTRFAGAAFALDFPARLRALAEVFDWAARATVFAVAAEAMLG
jgi:hypothetical protein